MLSDLKEQYSIDHSAEKVRSSEESCKELSWYDHVIRVIFLTVMVLSFLFVIGIAVYIKLMYGGIGGLIEYINGQLQDFQYYA